MITIVLKSWGSTALVMVNVWLLLSETRNDQRCHLPLSRLEPMYQHSYHLASPKFLRCCTVKVMFQLPDASWRAVACPVAAPTPLTLAAVVAVKRDDRGGPASEKAERDGDGGRDDGSGDGDDSGQAASVASPYRQAGDHRPGLRPGRCAVGSRAIGGVPVSFSAGGWNWGIGWTRVSGSAKGWRPGIG